VREEKKKKRRTPITEKRTAEPKMRTPIGEGKNEKGNENLRRMTTTGLRKRGKQKRLRAYQEPVQHGVCILGRGEGGKRTQSSAREEGKVIEKKLLLKKGERKRRKYPKSLVQGGNFPSSIGKGGEISEESESS